MKRPLTAVCVASFRMKIEIFLLLLFLILSYDFTPLDYSAVYVLSSMARRRRTSQSSGGAVSPDRRSSKGHPDAPPPRKTAKPQSPSAEPPAGGSSATPTKCKRPMNAFMLFAKRFRVEYTQMYPGKDNRWVAARFVRCD